MTRLTFLRKHLPLLTICQVFLGASLALAHTAPKLSYEAKNTLADGSVEIVHPRAEDADGSYLFSVDNTDSSGSRPIFQWICTHNGFDGELQIFEKSETSPPTALVVSSIDLDGNIVKGVARYVLASVTCFKTKDLHLVFQVASSRVNADGSVELTTPVLVSGKNVVRLSANNSDVCRYLGYMGIVRADTFASYPRSEDGLGPAVIGASVSNNPILYYSIRADSGMALDRVTCYNQLTFPVRTSVLAQYPGWDKINIHVTLGRNEYPVASPGEDRPLLTILCTQAGYPKGPVENTLVTSVESSPSISLNRNAAWSSAPRQDQTITSFGCLK